MTGFAASDTARLAGVTGELLSVRDAAHQVAVSPATVWGGISRGDVPFHRVRGRVLVRLADVASAQAELHFGRVIPAWREDPARVGAQVRTIREAAGLSQQALAARSGLSPTIISQLERGKRTPYAKTVRVLSRALGVSAEEFVGTADLSEPTWSVAETAAWLGVSTARIYIWLNWGVLRGRKVPWVWRATIMRCPCIALCFRWVMSNDRDGAVVRKLAELSSLTRDALRADERSSTLDSG